MHTYESWRITYQSAEQAARAAYQEWQRAIACKGCPVQQGTHVPMGAVVHPDDLAVDALSAAMKAKLARQRAKGYGGWDTDCTQQRLSDLLRGHVDKGDPVDVANFCAFLVSRGEGIAAAQQGVQPAASRFDINTSKGGRSYVAWYFSNVIGRHDFQSYIENTLAADFACALAKWLATHPTTQGLDAIRALIAQHGKELEHNAYAYFELAYTRQTGWMAWITDHPRSMPPTEVVNPDRKVLASGQGDTPEAACAAALVAQAKQGGE